MSCTAIRGNAFFGDSFGRKLMRTTFGLLLLAAVPLLGGCGTVAGWGDPSYGKFLVGVRVDLEGLVDRSGPYFRSYVQARPGEAFGEHLVRGVCALFWVPVDLIPSFAADVCFLPFAAVDAAISASSPERPPGSEKESARLGR
jgi:hypothetical protein